MKKRYEVKTFLISHFIYNFGRVLPHAILSIILLSKEISLAEIPIIQSMFMLAILLFEFPSGILSDMISEKKIYLLSLLFISISYLIIYLSSSFYVLSIAWFLYGMSAAGMSGSLDTYFMKKIKKKNKGIKSFSIKYRYSVLWSGLIGGGLGASLYQFFDINIYIVSIFLFLTAYISVFFGIENEVVSKENRSTFKSIIKDLGGIRKDTTIIKNVLLIALFQIMAQLFFQFWQLIFLEKHIADSYFGLFYVLFQFISLFSNYVFSRIKHRSTFNYIYIFTIAFLFIGATVFLQGMLFVFSFSLFLLPFNLYSNQLDLELKENTSHKILSSMVSMVGTVATIISMLTLWMASFLIEYYGLLIALSILALSFCILSFLTIFVPKWFKTIQ